MAFFKVGELKDSVSGLLQGLTLDNVIGLEKALERAVRVLSHKVDIPEASDVKAITLYDGVIDYAAPSDIFGGAVNDFRPQGESRNQLDYVYRQPVALFDRTKALIPNGIALTFEYNKGTPIVRIASPKPTPRANLDTMASDDGWTAAGSASGLTEDETVYYKTPSSLRFTLTGSSTGTLTKTINRLDIPKYEDVCVGFLAIRTPSVDDLTSVSLKVGSDSSNYDEVSATAGFLGAWVVDDWLLVAYDFSGSSSTGTPDWESIDYIQVSVAHTATITNFYVGGLWLSLPSPSELHYKTPAIFKVSGSLSKTITDDDDEIILNDSAYVLYEYECAVMIAEQSSGGEATARDYKLKLRDELYPAYLADNPSSELKIIGNYYTDF